MDFYLGFVFFFFFDCVFVCTFNKQMCLGVSISLKNFAACLGLLYNLSDSVLD